MSEKRKLPIPLIVVAVIALGGWIFIVTTFDAPAPASRAFYYDTTTKEVFVDLRSKPFSFNRDSGNLAVRAHYFSCEKCTEMYRFAGYYQRLASEADKPKKNAKSAGKKGGEKVEPDPLEDDEEADVGGNEGKFMFSKDGVNWVRGGSDEHLALMDTYLNKCGKGSAPLYCWP